MFAMHRFAHSIWRVGLALAVVLLGGSSAAIAAEGAIEINQASAMAGGVTLGDGAGFPVDLNEAGSYILTSNLSVSGDVNGIQSNVADVTIDLNGFAIIGPNTCVQGATVTCDTTGSDPLGGGIVGGRNTVVKNGIVRGMSANGINVGPNSRVEGMTVSDNGSNGIRCNECIVLNSTVQNNGGNGIRAVRRSSIRNNTVRFSGLHGIELASGAAVNNFVLFSGLRGIVGTEGVTVMGNHVSLSSRMQAGAGILVVGRGIVKDNVIVDQRLELDGPVLYGGNNAPSISAQNGQKPTSTGNLCLDDAVCP